MAVKFTMPVLNNLSSAIEGENLPLAPPQDQPWSGFAWIYQADINGELSSAARVTSLIDRIYWIIYRPHEATQYRLIEIPVNLLSRQAE